MRYCAACASGALAAGLLLGACGEPLGPVPVALVLTASDTITVTGATLKFSVRPVDSAGAVVPGGPIFWSVDDTLKGQVSVWGGFTARDSGRTWVRARLASPPLAESVAVQIVPPGTVKWTWAAAAVGGVMPTLGGPALASDGTVYVLVETGGYPDFPGTLVALAPDGTVRWTRPLLQVSVCNGVVVMPGTERLWVVGKAAYLIAPTGEVVWDTLADPEVIPDFLGGAATTDLLAAAWGKHVVVYRASDHARLWTSPEAPFISWLVPPTFTADGRLLVKHTRDTLFVFRATDGQLLRFFLDPDTNLDNRVWGVGTVPVGGRYYLPTRARLAAFDSAGPLLWLTGNVGYGMSEPAVGPDGMLYVQNARWGLQVIDPVDGTSPWYRGQVGAPLSYYGGPALGKGGIIYAAGQAGFYAYDAGGTLRWSHMVDSAGTWQAFLGAPAIAPDGTVYTFTSTQVYAFWAAAPPEPDSPWPMWRHDAQRTGWAR
jgi:hypothetical protein